MQATGVGQLKALIRGATGPQTVFMVVALEHIPARKHRRLLKSNHLQRLQLTCVELTFRGSTVVMTLASMKGLGLLAVSSMSDCHCRGRPTNFCSCSSKSVWTRCSKLDGAEIWIRDFFFLVNMMAAEAAAAQHQTFGGA